MRQAERASSPYPKTYTTAFKASAKCIQLFVTSISFQRCYLRQGMDQRVHVPVDDPNADTEWNDILRKHKIIPERPPSPTLIIQEAIEEARKQAHENRLDNKCLDELDELEDEEDESFLDQYRSVHLNHDLPYDFSQLRSDSKQRLAELSTITKTSIFNQVFPLQKPDYSKDVTEASHKAYVFVHLTSSLSTNVESQLLTELWREMARSFGDVKFCEIRADMCIEGYPERNTPTILVYRNGDIKKQIVTLRGFGGEHTTTKGSMSYGDA